jgi:uncharacterized membrane protein (DUF106 family)
MLLLVAVVVVHTIALLLLGVVLAVVVEIMNQTVVEQERLELVGKETQAVQAGIALHPMLAVVVAVLVQ